jgi:hypothetical protein
MAFDETIVAVTLPSNDDTLRFMDKHFAKKVASGWLRGRTHIQGMMIILHEILDTF